MAILLGGSMAVGQGIYPYGDLYPEDPIGNPIVWQKVKHSFREGNVTGDSSCWRDSTYTAGALVARATGDGSTTCCVNLACAGASSFHVLEQWAYAQAQWGTLLGEGDATILVSLGANDGLRLAGLQGGGTASLGTSPGVSPPCFPAFRSKRMG